MKLMPNVKKFQFKGFTLIELLVVITIIGILTGFATVSYGNAQAKSRDVRRKNDLQDIKKAAVLFYQDNQAYPCYAASNCSTLPSGGHSSPEGNVIETYLAPKYMSNLPSDPRNTTTCGTATATNLPYLYSVMPYGNSFTIFALLENTNDPDAKAVKPTPKYTPSGTPANGGASWTITAGSCQNMTYNYWVNSP